MALRFEGLPVLEGIIDSDKPVMQPGTWDYRSAFLLSGGYLVAAGHGDGLSESGPGVQVISCLSVV